MPAGITPEQLERVKLLAELAATQRRWSKFLTDEAMPTKKEAKTQPAKKEVKKQDIELIKTCPVCGSKNILEPENDAVWLCDDCMTEFREPIWDEVVDDAMKAKIATERRAAAIRAIQASRRFRTAQKEREEAKKAEHAKYVREVLVAERQAVATTPVCPNCGTSCYHHYRGKKYRGKKYKCKICGAEFDQPLKPGRSKAIPKAAKWEQKRIEAIERWHEKYGGDMQFSK